MFRRSWSLFVVLSLGSQAADADAKTEISVGATIPHDSDRWNTGIALGVTQRFATRYVDLVAALDWARWSTERSHNYRRASFQLGLGAHTVHGPFHASFSITAGPDHAWGTATYFSRFAQSVVTESSSDLGVVVTPSARLAPRFEWLDVGATVAFVISEHSLGSGADEGHLFPYSSTSLATMLTAGATY